MILGTAILLCTFNGEEYLSDQLDSYLSQTYSSWRLWVSDDGSIDKTKEIIERYQVNLGCDRVRLVDGPKKGYAANFMSLVCNPEIQAEYFAFSDQDDIWCPEKLKIAQSLLAEIPSKIPAIYCSRTTLVDSDNNFIGYSRLRRRPPKFTNAILENVGGGNTMVFNKAARDLIALIGVGSDIVSHDWWAYIVVSGCGGKVIYDPNPYVRYRQHSDNIIGKNTGLTPNFSRLNALLRGRYRSWLDININALNKIKSNLTVENKILFEKFCSARQKPFFIKLLAIMRTRVHRQTTLGNIAFLIACLINRV